MSNDITWNPLIIDTAAATAITNDKIVVSKIRWVDSGADIAEGDSATIKDKNGKEVWHHRMGGVGTVADLVPVVETDFPGEGLMMRGLIVSALTHGKLYIYCKRSETKIPVAAA